MDPFFSAAAGVLGRIAPLNRAIPRGRPKQTSDVRARLIGAPPKQPGSIWKCKQFVYGRAYRTFRPYVSHAHQEPQSDGRLRIIGDPSHISSLTGGV